MDTLIEDNTQDVHWELDEPSSKKFLETLFPDDVLLVNSVEDGSIQDFSLGTIPSLLGHLRKAGHYGSMPKSPSRCASSIKLSQVSDDSVCLGTILVMGWDSFNSSVPLKGAAANRKPDLLLSDIESPNGHDADWRDVIAFGEVKSKKDSKTLKSSYIEAAGKAAFILYAQDGRHAVLCVRILGTHIFFDIFDRGGSISTAGFDIHDHPEVLLHILLGLATASKLHVGFDSSIHVDSSVQHDWQTQRKRMTILRDGVKISVVLDYLIFITDGLHGCGTTVWKARMDSDVDPKGKSVGQKRGRSEGSGKDVVVKDCWIDPLRKYTEGMILNMLNKAGMNGVPKLISEEQVTINHPSPTNHAIVNNSTHLLCTLPLQQQCPIGDLFYYLRVHSRLVMEPVGYLVTSFSCLGELLVAFVDYVTAHQEALEKAHILHRDISLLNLLLVLCQCAFNCEHLPGDVAISLQRPV
ncbi:hypothetical protein BU15DRAFT_78334 [Melanogaster broomeanus]|nr:hypothetical protein BU15DRAFT_78334 [Melanogaster broomeanus]